MMSSFFGILLFLGSCYAISDKPTKDEKAVFNIEALACKKIAAKYNLEKFGRGAAMMDDVEELCLSFYCFEEISIDKARELVVGSSEIYLNEINSSEKLRPYLISYPFPPNRVEICIYFYKPDLKPVEEKSVSYAASKQGIISYNIGTEKDFIDRLALKETYEEAVAKVKASHEGKALN